MFIRLNLKFIYLILIKHIQRVHKLEFIYLILIKQTQRIHMIRVYLKLLFQQDKVADWGGSRQRFEMQD